MMEDLVREFEAGTLAREKWTHAAHLTVALWYLAHHPKPVAMERIRTGIQDYNRACGVEMTANSGYHETLTRFYIWAVGEFLSRAEPGQALEAIRDALLTSRYAAKNFPLEYYSRPRLLSWEARTGWVEPDFRPLVWEDPIP